MSNRAIVALMLTVEYDADVTDGESIASAMDTLLETAMSTPGVLSEYGEVSVGEFLVIGDDDDEDDGEDA